MSYWGFPKYVSVAEKKAKAAKKLKELSKKRPDMKPVALEGSALAHTWWGKAWNRNLEQYADYSNRIGRGRKPRVKEPLSLFRNYWPEISRRPWARYSYAKIRVCSLRH